MNILCHNLMKYDEKRRKEIHMKKFFSLIAGCFFALVLLVQNPVFADQLISVKYNGENIVFDVPPQAIEGRVMVPLRAIFEYIGAEVEWDGWTETATAKKDNNIIKCTLNRNEMYINGESRYIDVAPCVINERILVPVRFMTEALSCDVVWDGETNTVLISDESTSLNNPELWKKGGLTGVGDFYKSAKSLVTDDFLSQDVSLVYSENNFVFYPAIYTEAGEFIGFWNGSDIVQSASKTMFYINVDALKPYKVKIMLKKTDGAEISVEECKNLHMLNKEQAQDFYSPTLTFIDDDGALNSLENWESICDELGINITSALVTNTIGKGAHASWDDIARLQKKGFEFVSHTHNHINLTKSTKTKIVEEFISSISALREHGCETKYLVYPYNAINKDLMPLVDQYFDAGIGLGSGKTDNSIPVYTFHLRRYSINNTEISVEKEYNGEIVSVHSFKSLDELKDYIDDAVINGGWVIIMTHLRNDESFYFDEEMRANIIELCNYATEKGVEIKTFGEAYEQFKNKSEEGTIYDANYRIVDCNGVLHYK